MTTGRRYFTLHEANQTLPLVRRIVRDIVDAYELLRDRASALNAESRTPLTPMSRRRLDAIEEEIRRESERIDRYCDELAPIGCELKGLDLGLVDFHAMFEGRPVLLCWKLGEPRIEHWHELGDGFAGRRPITPEVARALG